MSETDNPLVTFALFAYNQEHYIQEAVEGALAQDYDNLEIILSDDCSSDRTFEIMESIAADYPRDRRLVINRNAANRGWVNHFNHIVSKAQGDIVVVGAGDDISFPDRVSNTVALLNANPEASIASFTDIAIDTDGKETHRPDPHKLPDLRRATLDDYISGKAKGLSGASRAYRKRIFTEFGPLNGGCPTEDTPSLLRGLMLGHAVVSSKAGIQYRKHQDSLSAAPSMNRMDFSAIHAQYLEDIEMARERNLVSSDTALQIAAWANRKYRRRVAKKALYEAEDGLLGTLKRVAMDDDFSIGERARMLKRRFLSRR